MENPLSVRRAAGENAVQVMPWEWFDLAERSHAVAGGEGAVPAVEEGGWRNVWHVTMDGRTVPFKFFRGGAGGVGEMRSARPVVMLMHGMGLSIVSFRGVAPYLFQTHDILLPEYSSFSARGGAGADYGSAKLFAQSLWRIADAVGVERLSLGGNSLGGGLSLIATLLEPTRVEKILLSNPACFPQTLPRTYRWARIPLVGEVLMAATSPAKLVDGLEYIGYADKTRFDPVLRRKYETVLSTVENRFKLMGIIRKLPADARDMTATVHVNRLAEIRQPVLLTWGDQDPLLAEGAGERLAAALPNVTFERYPDLSHMPHEEAPERVGRRWAEWLNET